jgi:Domain of unknown function (DUF4832)/Domain of unknown function (DUF4874)
MVGPLIFVAALIAACGGGTEDATSAAASDTAGAATPPATSTPAASAVWTECAQENEVCSFNGTRKVKYGVDAASVVRDFTNGATCDNATFGDPAAGQWKKCWYDASATVAATTPPTAAPAPAPTPAPTGATSATFTGSTADFLNPERGFYVSPTASNMTVPTLTHFVDYWHVRMFNYAIELNPYRNSAIPQSFLDDLNTQFAAARAAGVKLIVQSRYNSDLSSVDAPIDRVLQHISQLKPVLAQNADVIPFVKAGYIGAWGEWSGSTNGLDSDANKLAIKNALLANTPSTTIVHFRRPGDINLWYPNNPAAAAAARVGHHNDCYMANDTDAHTYNGLNDPLRDYVKKMAENSGFGGETCDNVSNADQMRLTCAQALSEHAAYHVSWLHAAYAQRFIDSWKAGGCYDQISRSMGYRLQLDSVNHAPSASRGTAVAVNVSLRNTGWARMFSKRALVVTLRNKSTGATITGSGGDLTTVASGASAQMTVNVNLPAGTTAGNYDVLISVPDIWSTTAGDARFAVRFANADSGSQAWDATNARFATGTSIAIQ